MNHVSAQAGQGGLWLTIWPAFQLNKLIAVVGEQRPVPRLTSRPPSQNQDILSAAEGILSNKSWHVAPAIDEAVCAVWKC